MEESLVRAINEVFLGANDDEKLQDTLNEAKMNNRVLDYDAAKQSFADYETLVSDVASKVDWDS